MAIIRRALVTIAAVASAAALVGGWGRGALAAATLAELSLSCEVTKTLAVGDRVQCLVTERARELRRLNFDYGKCEKGFSNAFARAEKRAGPGVCQTEGDTAAAKAMVDACMADIEDALGGSAPPPCTKFPATGQTTCRDHAGRITSCEGTGQDGDVRAGAALSYTDNGDGTITDNNTRLVWEKKTLEGDPDTNIHHRDKTYTWAPAAFVVHIAQLNTAPCFTGHCDWRLPNAKELQSIVNYQNVDPAVSPAFNTGCVAGCTAATCSCTASEVHWSSSGYALSASGAWGVSFFDGGLSGWDKTLGLRARAVRGGL